MKTTLVEHDESEAQEIKELAIVGHQIQELLQLEAVIAVLVGVLEDFGHKLNVREETAIGGIDSTRRDAGNAE